MARSAGFLAGQANSNFSDHRKKRQCDVLDLWRPDRPAGLSRSELRLPITVRGQRLVASIETPERIL